MNAPVDPPAPPAPPTPDPVTRPHHPPTIGPYRIIAILGEGGMGTVYEAQQDHPHRMVALKVIRHDYVSPELIRRFSRESEVLGRLQHPGIAQIYQAGTFEDPQGARPFFAMELVKGQPLSEYLRAHTLELRPRLELFARICDAVHYAHRQGVIHRDLKPANIMVDAAGQPKILDFGVARLTDADVQATRQTSIGEVVGTLQYMSPEQVNADPGNIDTRSDVYSLGVILYEVLSGRLPYDLARKLIYEAARIILLDDPAPLSSINRKLRGDVEVIVAKALEKEKSRRYDSAEALASDIRRFLNDEPIVARPATAIYQIRKFARRNRALVGGLALAALALLAGTAVSLWQAVRATAAERTAETRRGEAVASSQLAERRRAQADSALRLADSARAEAVREQAAATASAQRATDEAAKAKAVSSFLQHMLASSDPSNAQGKELSMREVLDQAAGSIGSDEITRQPEVRAGIETTIGHTYFGLGLYDAARPHLESAYSLRHRTAGPARLELGVAAADLAELYRSRGDYVRAERSAREALAIDRAILRPDDDQITQMLSTLAAIRYSRGSNADAERLHRQALELARSRHGKSGVVVAQRLRTLGSFLSYTDRPDAAEPVLEESLAILRHAYGDNHPQVVMGLIALSDAELAGEKLAPSEAHLREALPIARKVYGQEHPALADVIARLGAVLLMQRKLAAAEPPLREALAMRVKVLGAQHPDVQLARTELARLLQNQERFAEAETLFTQALNDRRAVLGDSSPAVAASLQDLGRLAAAQDKWDEAVARYREALPLWKAAHIEDEEIDELADIGFSLSRSGKLDEAEPILTDVLARRRARYGDNSPAVGDAYEKLSSLEFRRGHAAQAESLGAKGLEIRRKTYGAKAPQVAMQLGNMAFLREVQNDTSGALAYLREDVSIMQAATTPTDAMLVQPQRLLAIDLCATGATAEGDSVIRAAIAAVPMDSTQMTPFRLRAALGFCLTRAKRYQEAEPHLLQAEAGLRALLPGAADQRSTVIAWLVNLYEAWGRPTEATEWKGRMEKKP